MNKQLIAVSISLVLGSPAMAGGNHEGGHDNNEEHSNTAHHATNSAEKHEHDDEGSLVGSPAESAEAQQTIMVSLTDQMRINFEEDLSNLQSGMIVEFVVSNDGKIPHEFSIGSQAEQKAHGEMMRKMPGMVHADGNTITLQPGETRSLTWKFDGEEMVVFACNIPGHYEGGMYKKVPLSQMALP